MTSFVHCHWPNCQIQLSLTIVCHFSNRATMLRWKWQLIVVQYIISILPFCSLSLIVQRCCRKFGTIVKDNDIIWGNLHSFDWLSILSSIVLCVHSITIFQLQVKLAVMFVSLFRCRYLYRWLVCVLMAVNEQIDRNQINILRTLLATVVAVVCITRKNRKCRNCFSFFHISSNLTLIYATVVIVLYFMQFLSVALFVRNVVVDIDQWTWSIYYLMCSESFYQIDMWLKRCHKQQVQQVS